MKNLTHFQENLTSFDKRMIVFSLALSATALFFFAYYRPHFDLSNLRPVADIKEQTSDIKHKFFGSINWSNTVVGETLFNGDEIYTGDEGSAIIQLKKNKAALSLSPRSLVRIEEYEDQLKVNLEDGQIIIQFAKDGSLLLNSDGKSMAIKAQKNSSVRALKSSKGIALQLLKGKTDVNQQEIKDNKIYYQEQQNEEFKPSEFPEIISPRPNQVFYMEDNAPLITLDHTQQWIGEAVLQNIETNEKDKFKIDNIKDIPLKNLKIGRYKFFLVSKKSESPSIVIEVKTRIQFSDLYPKEKEELALERGQNISLSWAFPQSYKSKLTITNENIKKVFEINDQKKISFPVFGTSPNFTWSLLALKGNYPIAQSGPHTFSITYLPLKALLIPTQNTFSESESKILFSWNSLPKEAFELSINEGDKKIHEKMGIFNKFTSDKLKPGNYELKLSSKTYPSKLPFVFPFVIKQDEVKLIAVAPVTFSQLPKADDQNMTYQDYQGLNAYLIKGPTIAKAKQYEFFVASDSSHKNIVFKAKSPRPELHWVSKRTGILYFRYRVYDAQDKVSDFSPVSKLIFPKD